MRARSLILIVKISVLGVSVGADGRSDLGLKFDSLGLDPTSSQTSLTSVGERFDDGDSPESSLNRQVQGMMTFRPNSYLQNVSVYSP